MKPKQCEAELHQLREEIANSFKKGKIDTISFGILDKRIAGYLIELRERIVDDDFGGIPNKLKDQISASLEDGEIGEDEYKAFKLILEKTTGLDKIKKEKLGIYPR